MAKHAKKHTSKHTHKKKAHKKKAHAKKASHRSGSSRKVYRKQADGYYHIGGQKFKELVGRKPDGSSSRCKVWNGTAYKTPGGLVRSQLRKNKRGSIVSSRKSAQAKRDNRLKDFKSPKGTFVLHKKR